MLEHIEKTIIELYCYIILFCLWSI